MKSITPDQPWLMPEVIDWLDNNVTPGMTVLETGAGGSTVFFARRVAKVISFEHNAEWHAKVADELARRHMEDAVDLRFDTFYPASGLEVRTALPPIDLAFIDGCGRVRSILSVLRAMTPGGWLILDDSDRDRYGEGIAAARSRSSCEIVFRSGPDHTTAWRIK